MQTTFNHRKTYQKSSAWHKHGKHGHRQEAARILNQLTKKRKRKQTMYDTIKELMECESARGGAQERP